MKLQQVIEAAGHRICGGSPYGWKCYGAEARFLDFSDLDGNEDVVGCVYNPRTQEVFQVEVWVNPDNVVYRWINPAFIDAYVFEASERGVDENKAFDDVKFTDVPADSILDFAHSVIHGTYVHSRKVVLTDGDGSPTEWPFPTDERPGCCGGCHGDESECGGGCDDEDDEVDALIEKIRKETETNSTTWDVVLTTKHRLEVKAETMEDAYKKAQEFKEKVKVHNWGDDICWMDHWITKYKIGKRVE